MVKPIQLGSMIESSQLKRKVETTGLGPTVVISSPMQNVKTIPSDSKIKNAKG